jgi:ACR3 family arsenite transporter
MESSLQLLFLPFPKQMTISSPQELTILVADIGIEEDIGIEKQDKEIKLSFLDRFLAIWVLLAMVLGTLLAVYVPGIHDVLDSHKITQVSIPVFVGLLLMLFPVFCRVKYEELSVVFTQTKMWQYLGVSFVLNWILCPMIMAALAWATLPDLPNYRVGVLLIGVARCIAMVLIWNDLAHGNAEWCAILVAFNSVLQLLLFAPLGYFYTVIIGGSSQGSLDMWLVAQNVLIFLGAPFVAGALIRVLFRFVLKWAHWYDTVFIPFISPVALLGLLYTITVMFALQGQNVISQIGPVFRVTIPLVLYFTLVWFSALFIARAFDFPFDIAITQAYTAGSNNFELAMAVAIAVWGIDSQEALGTSVGPLVEVPVLLGLVYVAPYMKKYFKS